MAELKSLAHPEWPYTGTPWEWRGFGKRDRAIYVGDDKNYYGADAIRMAIRDMEAVYQKQNFGPELK